MSTGNQFAVEVPMMSDVSKAISSHWLITNQRKAMISALHSLEIWTGKNLDEIPANVPQLAELLSTVQPAALGITPKTMSNVRSLLLLALMDSGRVPGVVREHSKARPKDPAWARIWHGLTTQAQRTSVSRLATWCNRNGVAPQSVNDAIVDRVMDEMVLSSFRTDQYQVRRKMTIAWNSLVESFPDEGLQRVGVPPSRLKRTRLPLEAFPPTLRQDWQAFSKWAHGEDVFADDTRTKPLKLTTLDSMFRRVHLFATTLVQTGVDPAEIRSLRDLSTPDAFKRVLRHRLEAAGGKATYDNFYMAMNLFQVARDWVKVDEATLAELKRLKNKMPQPAFGMTRKNKMLVMKFDDNELKERLLTAPERIWKHVQGSGSKGRNRLAQAQAALGITILMYHPVRLINLTELAFDQHLFLREDGTSTLSVSAEETKSGTAVEFDIPPQLAERLIEYREIIAPAVMGKRPKHLFSNVDGTVKGFATVRYLVQRYIKLYVGVHMNPHVFRHLAAKLILDASPGAHVVVQHILGHKKLATTATFYAGFDTRRAGRHHQVLLEQDMAERSANRARSKTRTSSRPAARLPHRAATPTAGQREEGRS